VGRTQQYTMTIFFELAPDARDMEHPGAVYSARGLTEDTPELKHIPWAALRVMKRWDGREGD
jgi:hypothetical protein